jgi:hypothetical protein
MLPAILAKIGLPLLVNVVGGMLGRIDNPVAKAASEAVKAAGTAIDRGEITPEQVAEANRHVEKMAEIESGDYRDTIREVNATIRTEAQSEDAYVRRMRPTFGYVMAATWGLQMGAIAYTIVFEPQFVKEVGESLAALTVIWSVGLSVLGVYVWKRSADKAGEAGAPGALEALAGIFVKKKA